MEEKTGSADGQTQVCGHEGVWGCGQPLVSAITLYPNKVGLGSVEWQC